MIFEVKTIKERAVEAKTDKGCTFYYSEVPMSKMIHHKPELLEKGATEIVEGQKPYVSPTKIDVSCNFKVTPQMCDRLNKSKIVVVTQLWNETESDEYISKFRFEVLPLFDFEKFQDLIYDMCVAFDLQTKLPVEDE